MLPGEQQAARHQQNCRSPHLDRHAQIPYADGFVIAGADKAPPLIHKSDGVDGRQVVVILLRQRRSQLVRLGSSQVSAFLLGWNHMADRLILPPSRSVCYS